jgi:hypothetical protein
MQVFGAFLYSCAPLKEQPCRLSLSRGTLLYWIFYIIIIIISFISPGGNAIDMDKERWAEGGAQRPVSRFFIQRRVRAAAG